MAVLMRFFCAFCALVFGTLAVQAQEFPLSMETKFGTTVIDAKPSRVATLDFNGADDLLALGVQPVAVRYWYGDYPKAVWPWAEPLLIKEPAILGRNLDFEAVAAAEPDVILAMWSGIDQDAYDRLSRIAPVVAVPPGVGDYEMAWDERALLAGRAIGLLDDAERAVADLNTRFAQVRKDNPQWQGKTATVAYFWNGRLGVYGKDDLRPQVLDAMGLTTTRGVQEIVPEGQFTADVSLETLPQIDADVILWFVTDDDFALIENLPGKSVLTGGDVYIDTLLGGAFSHASLLSLPVVLDRLPDALDAALSDPSTPVDLSK